MLISANLILVGNMRSQMEKQPLVYLLKTSRELTYILKNLLSCLPRLYCEIKLSYLFENDLVISKEEHCAMSYLIQKIKIKN